MRYGSRGPETTCADLAREMEIERRRPWSWEAHGHFPGRDKLAELYARLERVRAERADPLALAKWVELGPDDAPPFDEKVRTRTASDGLERLARAIDALAKSPAARGISGSLIKAAKENDPAEVDRLAAAIKPLAKSKAARALIERLEEELHSVAGGVVGADEPSHLLQQLDVFPWAWPLSVA